MSRASASAAEELAAQLARFPQVCLRMDRLSAYEQFNFNLTDALRNEYIRGRQALQSPEIAAGVAQFQKGAGRRGKFD